MSFLHLPPKVEPPPLPRLPPEVEARGEGHGELARLAFHENETITPFKRIGFLSLQNVSERLILLSFYEIDNLSPLFKKWIKAYRAFYLNELGHTRKKKVAYSKVKSVGFIEAQRCLVYVSLRNASA